MLGFKYVKELYANDSDFVMMVICLGKTSFVCSIVSERGT